ncbi:hypothetical protein [Streptomyces sp. B1I3]|uniref:hypothetical protein n=1 Tax=Streptomyces sp. B1I3 TaxID=3042264 RepID=UPI002788DD8D|nr:hypothetical protein [Streptomyces sp. B1I3]MDQ0798186.1 DNA-directed RNA polymerase subunit RPC12/RpoP [Streptomyces sp. B1I3]
MANQPAEPLAPHRRPGSDRHHGAGPQAVLDFPPVPNGIDYLLTVVTDLLPDLAGKPPRIKYAVLHLQAAAEVLLKARLSRVHWSLVFKDPGKATSTKYADADFDSCTTDEAVVRLRNIAGIQISQKEATALKDLAKDRNALQHYGLTHNAKAVESRAATVLDFLVRFIEEHLAPELSESESLAQQMGTVRAALKLIQSFATERMNRLRGNELKDAEGRTLRCPDCQQLAVLTKATPCSCLFCGRNWPAYDLADYLRAGRHPGSPLDECPGCYAPTLTDDAEFADGKATLYCTNCASRYAPAELGNCAACGCYWPIDDTEAGRELVCANCDRRIRQEEDECSWM